MPKFTLGPYEAIKERTDDGIGQFEIVAPTPEGLNPAWAYSVANTLNRHHCISPDEDRANAHLLAAAWDMWRDLHYAKQIHAAMRDQFAELQGRVADANFAQHELDIILEVVDSHEPNLPSIAKAEGR